MSGVTAVSPLLLQRYELKYIIPFHLVQEISDFIEPFCVLDYYSSISHDLFYKINSLYFDSSNYSLLRHKKFGMQPAYSLRVRSYGDNPVPPFYSEVKIKEFDFSNKLRAKINSSNWAEIVQSGEPPAEMDAGSVHNFYKFISLITSYQAEPRILTQYRRKAYLSTIDNYARVTFDRDLRYQFKEDYALIPDENLMQHYDHEDIFERPDDCVILELKAEKNIPLWMIHLIQKFNLVRDNFSKYTEAIVETKSELAAPSDFQPYR